MPGGGKLTLETRNVVLDENYAAINSEVSSGNYVMIGVSDSGEGIPASLLDKVFEPFYTTKDVGKGSGLGLSMVYGFVKQSNGHIRIYSEEGHGTTVKLYLPQAAGVADAVPAKAGISEFERGDRIHPDCRGRRPFQSNPSSLVSRCLRLGRRSPHRAHFERQQYVLLP